ncbi:SDR family NAD(P)-dependent oxidoreductase [Bacillus benzoevorans]|uniref:NAD(P)-dependent dehydrogenase (Short-subunit alcohol dehydrogenase family) n=1 Tax=Bacillus benzoevorans TaxID=1456 RepID=A0A7X0LWF6_9BACI|nr:SDR family oxidoreductase [Bacillus benzoevorans]MBB6446605.1 NAD(P)-dependent dehydrogenase (short-subunit alcohol dehydrogenase family) [Bacillus benzoevorans]
MNLDLSGKVILITGGSRGLGAEMAREFAAAGADIILASRNKESCEVVANEVRQLGRYALTVSCDVSKLADIYHLYRIVKEEFGRLDVLVNNAGANVTKPALEVTEADWDYINDVNMKGVFFSCQEAAKLMREQGSGKIINISSVGGVKPYKRIAPYTATKAAVIHLTKSLAAEWARYNIHVNSIAPGLISTEINKSEMENKTWLEGAVKAIPLRRLGTPKDISQIALYLVSEASNYITGQTFFIDGGTLSE